MASETFNFTGSTGQPLSGRFDPAEGPHLATAIFAHCFTCGKDIHAARRIARRLTTLGIAVLRFDFTGLGQSEGRFEETSFSSNVGDIVVAAGALADKGLKTDLLIGHSLGGAAVLQAAAHLADVRAVATLGAPFDPGHVVHHFHDRIEEIRAEGSAEVDLGGRAIRIGREFVDDIAEANPAAVIGSLRRALLVMHAPRDAIVGIDNAAQIFAAARHPKSFVTLDGADHLISSPVDADYAAEVISAWAARYLDLKQPDPIPGAPEGVVRVSEADPDGFLQNIAGGPRHRAVADEPASYGGTDEGMTPYGFLAAGLGACTSMTIRMYARRKKWPLTGIHVEVSHDKLHVEDAESGDARADHFYRRIWLEGDLDGTQRARLLEIADKCPVHRTLEQSSVVRTELAT